jgi:hypothetical protein
MNLALWLGVGFGIMTFLCVVLAGQRDTARMRRRSAEARARRYKRKYYDCERRRRRDT